MSEPSVTTEVAPSIGQPSPGARPSPQNGQLQPPAVSLPKGGGAIRGIGEKFSANPVTGTGSMVVPIATSPGRSGFGPQLSASYDSGAGNGPYGFGWQLSTPAITRKTNQGIPRYIDGLQRPPTYRDTVEPDVFILSDAEDLVPAFRQDPDGTWIGAHPGYSRDSDGWWVRDSSGRLVIHEGERDGYRIRRYRPRVEGAFARIERWTNLADPADVHWRSISSTNILNIYGFTTESRITDPADVRRIFSWLICESRDDKGNAIIYRYREEDGVNVGLERAHERNRGARDDPRRKVNRYLKRILYGNTVPLLDANTGQRPNELSKAQMDSASWMFEVVFDYGDHDPDTPMPHDDTSKDQAGQPIYPWPVRPDPFSTYRSGFEVRTMRRCKRVLMFHHFPGTEHDGVGTNCLVKTTNFAYSDDIDEPDPAIVNPCYSFLRRITYAAYRRDAIGGYQHASLPALELEYSQPIVQRRVEDIPQEQLTNLPGGLDNNAYTWTDLHGEGIPGILTEQAGTWFYHRNLSPDTPRNGQPEGAATFAPLEAVAVKPNTALKDSATFMDLAGDGVPDLVMFDGAAPGLFEHDEADGWKPFRAFASRLNRDTRDPNMRLLDLVGNGRPDVLISEHDGFSWHESLAEDGFGPAQRTSRALDEEHGPRVAFSDANQSVFLADMSGDGLTDIVRIRASEVCYWPNLGYGRFGAKVTMDHAPDLNHTRALDRSDRFDPRRIRLADIDGSGTADIIYLHPDGVRLYFNQSGNSWSQPLILAVFPRIDELATITPIDLLGDGTACLVWSSASPAEASRPMRYVRLMAEKPHLLVKAVNNLGAETRIQYAPSTRFYLRDKREGKPWATRLPFPVHVVEQITTLDHIGRNRFTTRYAYHHGFFDGEEQEFRGFAMVEQWDTEELATLADSDTGQWANLAAYSHVPPVHTKTWFHTGTHTLVDVGERDYFRESGLTVQQARAMLLPDTVLPTGLTPAEEREAARALKGAILRREVYADDATPTATPAELQRARRPFTVSEKTFTVRTLQRRGSNRHGAFFPHAREAISHHYERSPDDPRTEHVLTLVVDDYGNVLKDVAIGYGRRRVDGALPIDDDRNKQRLIYITATENSVTNPIADQAANYRTPLPADSRTYELRKPRQEMSPVGQTQLYRFDDVQKLVTQASDGAHDIDYEDFEFLLAESDPAAANNYFRRIIEHSRTLYRRDSLDGLLPLGALQSLALPGESYQLAFTQGLLTQTFQRPRAAADPENLLPDPAAVLGSQTGEGGGYLQGRTAKADHRFPNSDPDNHWWSPSGRIFYSSSPADSPADEQLRARQHFFLARRYQDPFGHNSFVDFDTNDLLLVETRDALDNRLTATINDYRVLQPRVVRDANRNRTKAAFDTLGMVVGTALMGKEGTAEGDSLVGFVADLTAAQLSEFTRQPRQTVGVASSQSSAIVHQLLSGATTRFVYDLHRFHRTQAANPNNSHLWEPAFAATIVRETHVSDLIAGRRSKLQVSFSYSDGFGREIQRKVQAETGPLGDGGPTINPRWSGTGWTIFNNKGKPVRQYEPFFSATHAFEFGNSAGVSPVNFYDPADRLIATLYPNHSYDKVVFSPWHQITYDTNDTCGPRNNQTGDPRTDPDISGYVRVFFAHLAATDPRPWQTWYSQRAGGVLGPHEQASATRAAAHADTPTTLFFDALGRTFLTQSRNRVVCDQHELNGNEGSLNRRVDIDIEGNQRAVRDASHQDDTPLGRIVMRYTYNLLGNHIHQASMEAGARWMLDDVTGQPIRVWDSRGHAFTMSYDRLRRPVSRSVRGSTSESDPRTIGAEIQVEKSEYGEPPPTASDAEQYRAIELNLRTRLYRHRDCAGIMTNAAMGADDTPTEAFDFKGNLLRSTRRFTSDYAALPNWTGAPHLEDESFEAKTRYDALNRAIQTVAPHSSLPRAKRNANQYTYNDANLLEKVDVWLELDMEPNGLLDPTSQPPSPTIGITDVDYNAKGQREHIEYKNGSSTQYRYDPDTFRLVQLYSRRGAGFTQDCGNPPSTTPAPHSPPQGRPCGLQNLCYTYDPVGNITHIRDDAQQTIFFNNMRVEPSNDYTFDALYQLIEATGREHLGKTGDHRNPPNPPDASNNFHTRLIHPGDFAAMGRYTEQYVYDDAGNLKKMRHRGSDPQHPGWTREYDYNETSLTENGTGGAPLRTSNRLSRTRLDAQLQSHHYDPHGNTTYMQHLGGGAETPNMHWDYEDQLRHVNLNGNDEMFCIYDASGRRQRKVRTKAPGRIEERIYLGDFEIHRVFIQMGGQKQLALERETLNVMAESKCVALIETRTIDTAGTDRAPRLVARYQFTNQIGSVGLELDDRAQIISYEEYSAFGSTMYQALRNQLDTPKRYRFTGKERDEETGLNYHLARYYAPWLGRWISPDPAGVLDDVNLYVYARNSPTRFVDRDGLAPAGPQDDFTVGPYGKVGGDHTHQVADRTPGPNTRDQASELRGSLATSTKHPDYRDKAGQRVERKMNAAAWGKDINDPKPAPGSWETQVQSSGDTAVGKTEAARPSPWSADAKAYHKNLTTTGGRDPDKSLSTVTESARHLEDKGATVARVPNPPRQAPKDLKEGVPVSRQAPASKVFEPAKPEYNPYAPPKTPPKPVLKPSAGPPQSPGGALKTIGGIGGTVLTIGGGALAAKGFVDEISQGNVFGATVQGTSFASSGLIVGGAAAGSAGAGIATAGTVLAIPVAAYGLGKGALDAGSSDFAAAAGAAWDGPNAKGPSLFGAYISGATAIVTAPYFVGKGVFNSARDTGNWLGDASYRWLH